MSNWEYAHMDWTSPRDLAFWFFKSGAFEMWTILGMVAIAGVLGWAVHKMHA